MRLDASTLDFPPLASLEVHFNQNQLIHGPACLILDLLLVHNDLVRSFIPVRPDDYKTKGMEGESMSTIDHNR